MPIRWKYPSVMREPGTCLTIRRQRVASEREARLPCRRFIAAMASSTEVIGEIVVFLSVRVAARIVVVLAMPITRMAGLSTSSTVLRAGGGGHHVGAFGAHVVRAESDARPAVVVDRHERDIDRA